MILDYSEKTRKFLVRVPKDRELVQELISSHGLNLWSGSPGDEAILWTEDVYAALTYSKEATPAARKQIGPHLPELVASYSLGMVRRCAVPAGKDLFPFQKAGVDYVIRRTHSLIGDEPGLGKTPMAIVVANEMRAKRILVVCPANIRLQWATQVRDWSTMEGRYLIYPILKSADGVHPKAAWTIVSYDLLRSEAVARAIAEQHFDFVILDEAHYLKTPSAGRTQAIFGEAGVSHNAGAVLALTGTPLPNRPRECYTLTKGLCWDAIDYMSERAFYERYNPMELRTTAHGGRYTIEKKGRLHELKNRLRANYMVRRKKRDVLDQLPEIRYDLIHVEKTGAINKALEAEKMLDIDPENLKGIDAFVLGHISIVRREMGVAKAPLVADYVSGLLDGGEEKIVVFGWHISVLDIIQERLSKWGVVRVDGSTTALRRQLAVDEFVGGSPRVFLGNLQSIGVGVDGLQRVCSRGVFAECSWTPADNDQGVGRLERIGQKSGILIEFMVAPGSFDERILGSALRKLQDIHTSLDERI